VAERPGKGPQAVNWLQAVMSCSRHVPEPHRVIGADGIALGELREPRFGSFTFHRDEYEA